MRSRTRFLVLGGLMVGLLAGAAPGAAKSPVEHEPGKTHHTKGKKVAKVKKVKVSMAVIRHVRSEVAWHRDKVWDWQDRGQAHRTRSSFDERDTASLPYLQWMVRHWSALRIQARKATLKQERQQEHQWDAMNRDFETAVRVLAHRLGLDSLAGWVLSCADSEGGRGAWVPNRNGSGAGGWLQFLSGTFYRNAPAAWRFAQQRGVLVPREYMNWYSAVGQALTGLSMFASEGSGQWSGSGC